ncbi:MAG: hypothetical protein PHR49_05290 [Methanoculleus sp.]|jgi:hypothetical protein|uniref:hypothetical protein n=1 Tax=unclassified Methanoculleus TaxID=2619537 RepID=UPI0025EAB17F|nr:hypothetical protein [Methanoculleus sp. UBA377]MDD2473385.1 hypothetical protein [Methanoculleus sp.]
MTGKGHPSGSYDPDMRISPVTESPLSGFLYSAAIYDEHVSFGTYSPHPNGRLHTLRYEFPERLCVIARSLKSSVWRLIVERDRAVRYREEWVSLSPEGIGPVPLREYAERTPEDIRAFFHPFREASA